MRYITLFRKEASLDWDFHVSESISEAEQVEKNIKKRGVRQYSTYELGKQLEHMSSAY